MRKKPLDILMSGVYESKSVDSTNY